MNYLKRKLVNLAEYFHPAFLVSFGRGDSPEERKRIRHGLRPQAAPHELKREVVRSYARAHRCRILIETGTYKGDMLFAMLQEFDRLYSIELGPELYCAAVERFRAHPHVNLFEGDSAEILPLILKDLQEPAVFWLDAHASGGETASGQRETAIERELACILDQPIKRHVILIDDAREFGMGRHYPTLKQVRKAVAATYQHFEVKDDIVRITNRLPVTE